MNPTPRLAGFDAPRSAATRARRRAATAGFLAALLALLALAPAARAGDAPPAEKTATERPAPRWTSEVLDLARTLPVQDGGRVKPLDTYAQFTLLRLNHKRSLKTGDGDGDPTISSIEWLLDVVFRPERARRYPCFSIDTYEVLDAIHVAHEGHKKRDRYAYDDLAPRRGELSHLAQALHGMEAKERSAVEDGLVNLDRDVGTFETLIHLADFARTSVPVDGSPGLQRLFGGRATVPALEALSQGTALLSLAGVSDPHGGAPATTAAGPDAKAAGELRERLITLADSAAGLSIVPPAASKAEQEEWFTLGHLLYAQTQGGTLPAEYAALLPAFAAMTAAASDPREFERALRTYHDATSALATSRGEYDKIGLEVTLYRLDPFYRALWLYVIAFLVLAVTWLRPARWLTWGAWGLLLGAVGLQVAGIVIRCVLRDRPPISTLYETALFISALGGLACLVAEWISGRGIALSMAPVVGGLTLFVANKFEVLKGEDTMPQLVAVLDTNFWLATHVTCINLGYMGGLVAALLAHVTVLGRAAGVQRGNEDWYRSVARMTYGMLCFALFFSVVGTILGGIWANDSWGRFWGWDPKENGALLICLSQIAILHARMGGILKTYGVAMATIFQGAVVAFSWWGVNLLGIGLHSYGFTGGIMSGLMIFYGIELAVLGVGATTLLLGRAYGSGPEKTA